MVMPWYVHARKVERNGFCLDGCKADAEEVV